MRLFLAIVMALLGIGAIGSTILGVGGLGTFWQATHILAGLVMILGAITLTRQPDTIAPQDILDEDEFIGL